MVRLELPWPVDFSSWTFCSSGAGWSNSLIPVSGVLETSSVSVLLDHLLWKLLTRFLPIMMNLFDHIPFTGMRIFRFKPEFRFFLDQNLRCFIYFQPFFRRFCIISRTVSGFYIIFRFWHESSFSCLHLEFSISIEIVVGFWCPFLSELHVLTWRVIHDKVFVISRNKSSVFGIWVLYCNSIGPMLQSTTNQNLKTYESHHKI